MCMDDLKLFTKDEVQLKQALVIVKHFKTDVQMSFATVVIRNGKVVYNTGTVH